MNSKSDIIDAEITYGIDKGSPDSDMTALTIKRGKKLFTFVGEEAEAVQALLLRERLDERAYFKQVIDDVMSGNISPHFATALADDKVAEAQQELSRLSGEESHE